MNEVIEIKEETTLVGSGVILEKGDKIQILESSIQASCGYLKIAASKGSYPSGVTVEVDDYRSSMGGREFSFFDENHKLLVNCVIDLARFNKYQDN